MLPDAAVLSDKLDDTPFKIQSEEKDKLGGIDLNPTNLELEVEKEGDGVVVPTFDLQQLELNNINGFTPLIIEIVPVDLSPLLGFAEEEDQKGPRKPEDAQLSYQL